MKYIVTDGVYTTEAKQTKWRPHDLTVDHAIGVSVHNEEPHQTMIISSVEMVGGLFIIRVNNLTGHAPFTLAILKAAGVTEKLPGVIITWLIAPEFVHEPI